MFAMSVRGRSKFLKKLHLDSTLTPPNGKDDPEHPGQHDPEHPGQHPQQHPWQHPAQHFEQHPDGGQLANTMPPFEKLEPL